MSKLLTACVGLLFAAGCVKGPPADGGDFGTDATVVDGGDAGVPTDTDQPDAGGDPGTVTRYPADLLVSPFTPSVVAGLRAIEPGQRQRNDATFMKVGASETVSDAFLTCFAESEAYDLADQAPLQPTIDHFDMIDFEGQTSFERDTEAAEVGVSADWVLAGDPESPLDREIAAMNPRFALVSYGTNDMNQGTTHESALRPFVGNMENLLSELVRRGVVPVVSALPPRTDSPAAALWVPTYAAVTRALAEKYQVPFIDLHGAMVDLPAAGRVDDGIHGNAFEEGACVLTSDGLQFGYNVRNLLTLQTLDLLRRTVVESEPAPDDTIGWRGTGAPDDPFQLDGLPFSHSSTTTDSPHSLRDGYPSCDDGQDESGPEHYYRLSVDTATPLRLMVFDGGADVDIHVLDDSGDPSTDCLARGHRMVQGTLPAGDWTFVVDTFVSAADGPLPGAYTFVVVECAPDDPACQCDLTFDECM